MNMNMPQQPLAQQDRGLAARALERIVDVGAFAAASHMHPVSQGRIFCRINRDKQLLVVGVVSVPLSMPRETFYPARLNDRLHLSLLPTQPSERRDNNDPAYLVEYDASNILDYAKFASKTMPDGLEVFLRHTVLPHSTPGMGWSFVIGASDSTVPAITEGGLYEWTPNSPLRAINHDPQVGWKPGQVLRQPLWGPDGSYGLAHSMEPSGFPEWVKKNRKENTKRDPVFARYMEAMDQRGPMPLYYTAQELQEREAYAEQVVKDLVNDERGGDAAERQPVAER